MHNISVISHLPHHVIRQTVEHVVGKYDIEGMFEKGHRSSIFNLAALHMCQSWRTTALSVLFAGCKATIGKDVRFSYGGVQGLLPLPSKLQREYSKYVCYISMDLNFDDVVNGWAAHNLDSGDYSWVHFPNAHFLDIQLQLSSQTTAGTTAMQNVAKFIWIMEQCIPKVDRVTIAVNGHIGNSVQSLKKLFTFICCNRQLVKLESPFDGVIGPVQQLLPENSLTKLRCQWTNSNYLLVAQTIYANAQSLNELLIGVLKPEKLAQLFFDAQQQPITYTNLTHFVLVKMCRQEIEHIPAHSSAVPFPHLNHLEFSGKYPFKDDMPLRGNSSTLNGIGLILDHQMLQMLLKISRKATRSQLPLKDLLVYCTDQHMSTCAKYSFTQLFDCLFRTVERFFTHDQHTINQLLLCIPRTARFSSLESMSLLNGNLTLVQFAQLLCNFPQMTYMICAIDSVGVECSNMSMLEVSCMLRRQLEVARVSLSRCMLAYLEKMPVNTAAQLVVLVISICPRLKMVMFGRRTEGRALQVFMKLYEAQRSGKLAGIIPSNTCFSLSNVDVRPAIRITSTSRLE